MTKENPSKKNNNLDNDDLIEELMKNSSSTKYLVARIYVEFSKHFVKLNSKVGFHDKFIWTFIGILIVSFVGGIIALLFQFFSK